jgi:hypothetical protein
MPAQLEITEGGVRLKCELVGLDTLGCAFMALVLETDRLAQATSEKLREISESIAKRVTYLLEPISPIEVDVDHCVVQLRSSPPHRRDDATSYYELTVRRGGQIALRRWTKPVGDVRSTIPAHVTREVLRGLAPTCV